MTITAINASIYTFDGEQYIAFLAHQEITGRLQEITGRLRQENADLRGKLSDKEMILTQMGEQLREAMQERWHLRLDKVSVQKCPTPQKKLLAALQRHGSAQPVRVELLAREIGMGVRTVQGHLNEMEGKRYLSRRYDRNDLYIQLDPEVERTPFSIEKMTPVQRNPNWGGAREKKSIDDLLCSNCGSPHLRGHRHESYQCDDCGFVGDEWTDIPDLPTVALPAVQVPVVQAVVPVVRQQQLPEPVAPEGNEVALGRHPRGIACPDCGRWTSWAQVPTTYGTILYVCTCSE